MLLYGGAKWPRLALSESWQRLSYPFRLHSVAMVPPKLRQ